MNTNATKLERCEGEGFADWQLLVLCTRAECPWFHVTPFVPFGTPAFVVKGRKLDCPACGADVFVANIVRGGRV